jgi:hypothetical protein
VLGLLEREVAFIQKPFVPDALLRKLRKTLDALNGRGGAPTSRWKKLYTGH